MSEMARLPGLCIIFQAFQAQSIKLLPNSNVRNKAYHISSIIIGIHKLVVKLHVIRTKENNDRYFERYFATRVIMDIILPPW